MLDHFTSLVTLISLVVLGPALGKVILRNPKQQFVQAVGTMVAISVLLAIYGVVWSIRPRSVAWYSWLRDIPIYANGVVEVNGGVEVQEPLRVQIER